MAKNNYPTRTTLWDEDPAAGTPAPQLSASRGAWRAPSAVLAERSEDRPARRIVSTIPAVALDEDDGHDPTPRRNKFAVGRTSGSGSWWRPRSTFGRILLATCAVLVLGGLTALAVLTRSFLLRDPRFRIGGVAAIQSTGLSEVSRADVLPVFGEDIGRNLFFVPLAERRKQIESIPWVQQATVMRFLPDRLSVSIVERTPIAFVRIGNQVQLADADGVLLTMPPAMMAQHHYSFPVLTGIDPKDSLAGRRNRMTLYQRFLSELDQNHQHLTGQVSEIDLSDPEDLRATMPEQGSDILAHFGEDHFLERLGIYNSHIAEWRQRYPRLIGVDLRYSGDVPLEMAPEAAASQEKPAPQIVALIPSSANPSKPSSPAKSTPKTAHKPPAAVAHAQAAKLKAAHKKPGAQQASAHKVNHESPITNH